MRTRELMETEDVDWRVMVEDSLEDAGWTKKIDKIARCVMAKGDVTVSIGQEHMFGSAGGRDLFMVDVDDGDRVGTFTRMIALCEAFEAVHHMGFRLVTSDDDEIVGGTLLRRPLRDGTALVIAFLSDDVDEYREVPIDLAVTAYHEAPAATGSTGTTRSNAQRRRSSRSPDGSPRPWRP